MTEKSSIVLTNKVVLSLVGYQGSGKSTLGALLAHRLDTGHVEVSNVVKSLTGIEKRENLPATGKKTKKDPYWLGKIVAEVVEEALKQLNRDMIVITGVREIQVHDFLEDAGAEVHSFEITSPADVRYQRLRGLEKTPSAKAFIEQELREKVLGVDTVIRAAPFRVPTSEKTKPPALVSGIKKILYEKEILE